ncbi:hypothetical protein A2387_01350 [Candidatus Nomurabacteria bacterium RIFOXYB1_FULL_36_10]|nr:MAG: hypothetical protein A2387_01350 [Candidatus Nomurabacteria bacterium RIFOXYB1_FULL_36_10]
MPMSEKISEDKLYSLQEVAKHLRVSERSVFRYIHSGKLRATKIGYWRISAKDLRAFLLGSANVLQHIGKQFPAPKAVSKKRLEKSKNK